MLAVETIQLSKRYRAGTDALRDVDLAIQPGEACALLGANGAGKTTAIRCLLDLVRPTRGSVAIFGRPVSDPRVRARVGYLPESVTLHAYYRGRELLEFYGALLGLGPHVRRTRADEVLALLGLESEAGKRVAQYSKGTVQRLGFAQALLHHPELLVLDEPTSNLDPVARRQVADVLRERKRQGVTILISSHILSDVEQLCDRVAILKDGAIVRAGTLEELCATTAVMLHVKGVPAAAIDALVATGGDVAVTGAGTTVRCGDDRIRRDVEVILAQHGVAVERREAERPPLEDVLLAAMRGADGP